MVHEHWELLRKKLLWVYRAKMDKPTNHAPTAGHQSAVLVLDGFLEVTLPNHRLRAERNQWLLLPPSASRIQTWPGHAHFISVGWQAVWPNGEALFSEGLPVAAKRSEARTLEDASERLFAAAHGAKRAVGWEAACEHSMESFDHLLREEEAFLAWLRALAELLKSRNVTPRSFPNLDPRVRALVAILEHHHLARPIDCRALSTQVGLGWRRLAGLFREQMGQTPAAYLDRRRFESARDRLLAGSVTAKGIAYDLGFRHISHFSAWFRRHQGVSPRQFLESRPADG